MRLNKKKLAALAMSAVMAASTMPFPVMAEEVFTDGDEVVTETFEDAGTAQPVTITSVVIDKTGKVTVTYSNGNVDKTSYTATITTKAATCTSGKKVVGNVIINGVPYEQTLEEGTPLGHTNKDYPEYVVTKGATCTHTGTKDYVYKCKVCGEVAETLMTNITIPLGDHTYGEPYVKIEDRVNLDEDLKLLNPNADGSYNLVTYKKCSECDHVEKLSTVPKTVTSTNSKISYKTVRKEANSNIVSDVSTWDADKLPADSTVELEDCTKDGVYWIDSFRADGIRISTEPHTVKAHHLETVSYKAVKESEQKYLDNVVKDGKVVGVKNNSCYKPVEYYEITKCTATGCTLPDKVVSEVKKVAEPAGAHVNSYVSVVKNWIKNGSITTEDGLLTKTGLEYLKNWEGYGNYKVTRNGDCEEEGTVVITFTCEACGKEMADPVTVKSEKMNHKWSIPTVENKVEATCSKDGSYDTVQTCETCGKKEVVRTGVVIPATGEHSFIDETTGKTDYTNVHITFTGTKVVDFDGINLTRKGMAYVQNVLQSSYRVSAAATIKCETCGEEISQSAAPTLTVVDVTKETAKEAGSITIKATWNTPADVNGVVRKIEDTYTVPYYSSISAYLDRDPEKDPINGLHKDEDGVWRYYENNEVTDFTGIAEYQGGKFFVANGVLCSDAKGLNLYNGEWYFLAGGQIQTQVTGLAMYNGEWFFLTNGKLDRSKTGLVEYDGAKFIIAKGELQRYSGLWQDPADGTWYFAALGQIQEQYTGTAIYDGQTFELVNGKLVR